MTVAQKKKYLGVGWLPSLYAATFSSWFCYSLLHAECSLLLLLDMFSVTVAGRLARVFPRGNLGLSVYALAFWRGRRGLRAVEGSSGGHGRCRCVCGGPLRGVTGRCEATIRDAETICAPCSRRRRWELAARGRLCAWCMGGVDSGVG